MARTKKTDAIEVGQRLIRTRVALGYDKRRRFAQIMDVNEDNLEKWENGGALTPTHFVQRLKDVYKITFDWLYGGDLSGLPHTLAVKLVESEPAESD